MSVFALCPHYSFKLRIKENDFVQIKYSLQLIQADSFHVSLCHQSGLFTVHVYLIVKGAPYPSVQFNSCSKIIM